MIFPSALTGTGELLLCVLNQETAMVPASSYFLQIKIFCYMIDFLFQAVCSIKDFVMFF